MQSVAKGKKHFNPKIYNLSFFHNLSFWLQGTLPGNLW